MTHPAPGAARPSPPALSASVDSGVLPRWTLERMDLFLRTLRRTGSVAAGARAVGMSRQAAYKLRARLRGHAFDRAWEAATAPQAHVARMIAEHAPPGATRGDTA